jgi:hypothetical protein
MSPRAKRKANQTADAIEQQVVAFVEQLGRVVGTVQAKSEGWLDPKALADQVSRIRDRAASLLRDLALAAGRKAPRRAGGRRGRGSAATPIERGARVVGRSGGVVDAPGKKHRKPVADTPLRASAPESRRIAKMKTLSANRKRGRG